MAQEGSAVKDVLNAAKADVERRSRKIGETAQKGFAHNDAESERQPEN